MFVGMYLWDSVSKCTYIFMWRYYCSRATMYKYLHTNTASPNRNAVVHVPVHADVLHIEMHIRLYVYMYRYDQKYFRNNPARADFCSK